MTKDELQKLDTPEFNWWLKSHYEKIFSDSCINKCFSFEKLCVLYDDSVLYGLTQKFNEDMSHKKLSV